MGLRINFNGAALNTHRTLAQTDTSLGRSIERLSSGYRINTAADDPAGLVISEKLRAQVSGLGQAIRNASDAVNMVKTAEGALNEVHRLLRSMRDLAVHAANTGATDQASILADQSQIANAIASINKIGEQTQFGQKKLLDGSAGIQASLMGTAVLSGDFANPNITLNTNDKVAVDVTTAAERGYITLTGLSAAGASTGTEGSFTINGMKIEYEAEEAVESITNQINAISNSTGVTARFVDGTGIILSTIEYGAEYEVTATSSNSDILGGGNTNLYDDGVDAQAAVTVSGADLSDATWTAGSGLTLKDSRGNQIILTEAAGSATNNYGDQFTLSTGSLVFQVGAYKDQTRFVNIPAIRSSNLGVGAVGTTSVEDLNVTTPEGAQNAIAILDKAITDISNVRARLGATQTNVLESSIRSLTIAKENIESSESTIRDTDMAAEMVTFTKMQILQQAGVSMLAQANQAPQNLLSLLR